MVNVYVVIVACGSLGLHVTLDLVANKHDVTTIIEKDKENYKI